MRSMWLAPLVLGFSALPQDNASKRTVSFPTGQIEALGACDVRPEAVSCWNLDRVKAPELEEAVVGSLSSGNEVSFRLGKKNRYLVVKRPQMMPVNFQLNNDGLNSQWYRSSDPTYDFLRVSVDQSTKSATITASVTVQSLKEEDIAFRTSTTATIDGRLLEVGEIGKLDLNKIPLNNRNAYYVYGRPPSGGVWSAVFGLKGKEGEYLAWSYTPVDASGEPIKFVDAAGRPISAVKALALEPTLNVSGYYGGLPEGGKKPKAAVAFFQANGQAPAFRATTNINPKAIAKLKIRTSRTEGGVLGPFPLDPK